MTLNPDTYTFVCSVSARGGRGGRHIDRDVNAAVKQQGSWAHETDRRFPCTGATLARDRFRREAATPGPARDGSRRALLYCQHEHLTSRAVFPQRAASATGAGGIPAATGEQVLAALSALPLYAWSSSQLVASLVAAFVASRRFRGAGITKALVISVVFAQRKGSSGRPRAARESGHGSRQIALLDDA